MRQLQDKFASEKPCFPSRSYWCLEIEKLDEFLRSCSPDSVSNDVVVFSINKIPSVVFESWDNIYELKNVYLINAALEETTGKIILRVNDLTLDKRLFNQFKTCIFLEDTFSLGYLHHSLKQSSLENIRNLKKKIKKDFDTCKNIIIERVTIPRNFLDGTTGIFTRCTNVEYSINVELNWNLLLDEKLIDFSQLVFASINEVSTVDQINLQANWISLSEILQLFTDSHELKCERTMPFTPFPEIVKSSRYPEDIDWGMQPHLKKQFLFLEKI